MKKIRFFILLVYSVILAGSISGQSAFNFDLTGLGFHPLSAHPNKHLYENSISDNGQWVIEPGIIISYQKFVRLTHTSIQLSQGIYSDAAAQFAGFTGLYIKRKIFHKYKHSFSIAMGGAYLFRDKWTDISRYVPQDDGFTIGKKMEHRFGFSAELKYYIYFTQKSDLSAGLWYGHQYQTFTFTLGYRYWINPIVKLRDCNDCGEKKFNRKPIRHWIKTHIKI